MEPSAGLYKIWEELNVGPYDEVITAEKITKNVSKEHLEKYVELNSLIHQIPS